MSFSDFTTDNEILAKRLKALDESVKSKPNEFDARLSGRYIACRGEDKSLTIEFPVLDWEANYAGILHGGVICAMLDHTAGVAAICFRDSWAPTVDMTVHFRKKNRTHESKPDLEGDGQNRCNGPCNIPKRLTEKTIRKNEKKKGAK